MKSGEKRRLQQQHSRAERPRDVEIEGFFPRSRWSCWCCSWEPGYSAGLAKASCSTPTESTEGGRQRPGLSIPKYFIEIQKLSHNFVKKQNKKKNRRWEPNKQIDKLKRRKTS